MKKLVFGLVAAFVLLCGSSAYATHCVNEVRVQRVVQYEYVQPVRVQRIQYVEVPALEVQVYADVYRQQVQRVVEVQKVQKVQKVQVQRVVNRRALFSRPFASRSVEVNIQRVRVR